MQTIFRQALGVIIGGLIVAGITLAPRAGAQEQITVTSLNAPMAVEQADAADKRITYQGMVLNANGQPLATGTYYMVFSIYDSPSGGQMLWSYEFNPNNNNGVQVTNGLFTVLLPVGKDNTANTVLFSGSDRFLGVRVGADPEATPRQPLLYVPYAFWARNADSLGGKGSHYLPLAYGIVDSNGSRIKGTNFSSAQRGDNLYEVTINNVFYELNDYVTVVTPISQASCPRPTVATTNSFEGKLLVELQDRDGNARSCKFHFVVYEPKD